MMYSLLTLSLRDSTSTLNFILSAYRGFFLKLLSTHKKLSCRRFLNFEEQEFKEYLKAGKMWTCIKFDSDFYAEDVPFESPIR